MDMTTILFYILAIAIVVFSLGVVMTANPIFSALFLALTMVTLAFVYFLLNAPFIAGVQLIVYAGAVVVLFVMVMMLFDLKQEKEAFTKGKFTGFLKIASAGWLCGLIAGAIYMSTEMVVSGNQILDVNKASTKILAKELFSNYVFAFEALGILLLLIAVGAVSISRIKGGTHAK
ncbi:MAG: NADH-quinone oxidoreductase subunit J [Bdellovibrionaceae bacterium]|nr:NADH-quinone oxidoreductase subunit J [Pseudobdellovibrionaceae bacterium]